jgi:hypothetical protein
MPLHKFIHKHARASVNWKPHKGLTYPAVQTNDCWKIFTQKSLLIQPKSAVTLRLGLGVRIEQGVCLVSLAQSLKEKLCSLQDGFITVSVDDMIVTIQNYSDSVVLLQAGVELCHVTHV